MAANFVQSDIATGICTGSLCSGVQNADSSVSRNAFEGGTPGVSPASVLFGAVTGLIEWGIKFQVAPGPGYVAWKAGTHTVPFRVSVASADVILRKLWACWVATNCAAKATLGLNDTLSISMGMTGVKSPTVTLTAPSNPLSTDRLLYVFGFENVGAGAAGFTIVPDQIIVTPFNLAAPFYRDASGLYVPGPQAVGLYVPGPEVAGVV